MTPESICVTLATAKKLKEAGWDKLTVFVWWHHAGFNQYILIERRLVLQHVIYPAPTASEIPIPEQWQTWKWSKGGQDEYCCEENTDGHKDKHTFWAESEVEARAAAWLYLKGGKE
jgi:hypothetical protein